MPHAGGRPIGSQNKINSEVREIFSRFLHKNAAKMEQDYEKIRQQNPVQALNLLLACAEYVLPKLARIEQDNKHSGTITFAWGEKTLILNENNNSIPAEKLPAPANNGGGQWSL